MSGFFIVIVIVIIIIVIFNAGGKELDRRLSMSGGLLTMYAPLVDYLLSKPRTVLLKNTPSRLVIGGQLEKGSYIWQISTPDGKKLTIRITVKYGNHVIEKKEFNFPMSSMWSSDKILESLHWDIDHQEIFNKPIAPHNTQKYWEAIKKAAPKNSQETLDKISSINSEVLEEEIDLELSKRGWNKNTFGGCHDYWEVKKYILKEHYGITWFTPPEENPDVLYD